MTPGKPRIHPQWSSPDRYSPHWFGLVEASGDPQCPRKTANNPNLCPQSVL